MRYKILVLLTFVLFGCNSEKKKPKDLMTQQQMVSFLIDIHVLEGKLDRLSIRRDSSSVLFNTFEREILKEHNLDKEVYLKSYQYYMNDVKGMNDIYTAVVDSLNFLQTAYDARKEKEKEKEKAKAEAEELEKKTDTTKLKSKKHLKSR